MENPNENNKVLYAEKSEAVSFVEKSRDFVEDLQAFEQSMVNVGNVVNNVTQNFGSIIANCNQTALKIKELDAKLDLFLAQVDANVEKFTAQLPMIERLLNRISDRIDKTAEVILARNRSSLTKEELQQQSLLLDIFQRDSDSFNDLIMKLMLR